MRKPDSAGDQSLVPPRVAEAGAKVFYTYVERASLLGLLVFLFHKGEKTWTELPLGLLCVVGSVLLIAPVVAHAQLRIRGMVLRASGARLWRTFALALLLVVVLAVGAASVAIAVGEVLSKAFD